MRRIALALSLVACQGAISAGDPLTTSTDPVITCDALYDAGLPLRFVSGRSGGCTDFLAEINFMETPPAFRAEGERCIGYLRRPTACEVIFDETCAGLGHLSGFVEITTEGVQGSAWIMRSASFATDLPQCVDFYTVEVPP